MLWEHQNIIHIIYHLFVLMFIKIVQYIYKKKKKHITIQTNINILASQSSQLYHLIKYINQFII